MSTSLRARPRVSPDSRVTWHRILLELHAIERIRGKAREDLIDPVLQSLSLRALSRDELPGGVHPEAS